MTMKEFFKQQLISLEKNTGLKQYEKLLEKERWDEEVDELLNVLCRVCNQFDYIPNEDKAKIIKQNVITDTEFQGFNARIIYKWLSLAKSIYFKEQAHIEAKQPEDYKPLEGEARAAKLDEWLKSLGAGMSPVPQLKPDEIKREGVEWSSRVDQKATKYKNGITLEQFEFRKKLQRAASELYKNKMQFDLKTFEIDGVDFAAESEADAEKIIIEARKHL